MEADFAEVGSADFSEICLLVSVAVEARSRFYPAVRFAPLHAPYLVPHHQTIE